MPWIPKQTVVVPVDFSPSSAPAVRTALDLAATASGVHVVHVITQLNPVLPIGWGSAEAAQQLADRALLHLQTFLASHDIDGVSISIEVGQPANRIVEYADEQNADLVVIPSHGYHGLKRALLGSVAEYVIRHANVPTLVLRCHDGE